MALTGDMETAVGGASPPTATSTGYFQITLPSMPTGWVCPRCNTVNAPSVQHCMCPGNPAPMFPTPIYPNPWIPWEPWRPWTPNSWYPWYTNVNGSSSRDFEIVAVPH